MTRAIVLPINCACVKYGSNVTDNADHSQTPLQAEHIYMYGPFHDTGLVFQLHVLPEEAFCSARHCHLQKKHVNIMKLTKLGQFHGIIYVCIYVYVCST